MKIKSILSITFFALLVALSFSCKRDDPAPSESVQLIFVYDQNSYFKSDVIKCFDDCQPVALPDGFANMRLYKFRDSKGIQKAEISFDVIKQVKLEDMKLLVSVNGKDWVVNFIEYPDKFSVGRRYAKEFYIRGF